MTTDGPPARVNNLQTHFTTRSGLVRAVDGVIFISTAEKLLGLVGEWVGEVDHRDVCDAADRCRPENRQRRNTLRRQRSSKLSDAEMRERRGDDIAMIFQDR